MSSSRMSERLAETEELTSKRRHIERTEVQEHVDYPSEELAR